MGFWKDLGDSLTGKTKQEFAAAQLQAQMDALILQAEAEKAELEAKTSPGAIKARTQQITVVVSIIGGLILLFILAKIFKWF